MLVLLKLKLKLCKWILTFRFCFAISSGKITSQRSGVTIVAKKTIFVLTTNAGGDEIVNVFNANKAISSDETKRILENSKVFEDAELR